MNIFLLLTIAMLMIILMLRRHIPIGPCMLTSGIFIWLMKAPELPYLVQALRETLTMPRTYDILFALYFVMCLEIELRTSGALAGMVQALQRIFSSAKVTLNPGRDACLLRPATVTWRRALFCTYCRGGQQKSAYRTGA